MNSCWLAVVLGSLAAAVLLLVSQEGAPAVRRKTVLRADLFTEPKLPVRYHSQWNEDQYMMGVISRYLASECSLVHRLGNPKLNGVFIEIGAHDGVSTSNTLAFEESLGWTGLLIEANPSTCAKLLNALRPRSTKICAVVCNRGTVKFSNSGNTWINGIVEDLKGQRYEWIKGSNTVKLECRPMGALLNENGITSIDIFSLDVEGAEVDVLQTMDWSIKVHYWLIENDYNFREDLYKIAQIHKVMLDHNYVLCPNFLKLRMENECWMDPTFID